MESQKLQRPNADECAKRAELEKLRAEGKITTVKLTDYINSFDWSPVLFEEKGKYGLKNYKGEVIMPPEYEDFKLGSLEELRKGDRIVAMQNGKWGIALVDTAVNWLIKPEFDDIGYPNNLVPVCKNGKWGVLNLEKMDYLIRPDCDKIWIDRGFMFVNGIGCYEKEGKMGVITSYGAFTDPIFDEVEGFPEDFVKVLYNGEWGYINENNEFTTNKGEACYRYYID